jgi:hypothetical protein
VIDEFWEVLLIEHRTAPALKRAAVIERPCPKMKELTWQGGHHERRAGLVDTDDTKNDGEQHRHDTEGM